MVFLAAKLRLLGPGVTAVRVIVYCGEGKGASRPAWVSLSPIAWVALMRT